MARIPAQVSRMLDDLVAEFLALLDANLVGVYLYGSLTQRAFNPERSDVDCIVVTRRSLGDAHFRKLRSWLNRAARSNPWTTRLQLTCLLREEVLTMNSRACFYQFGQLRRGRSDGNPIIWINVLQSGRILYGPIPQTFLPPITRDILVQALEREVRYLREEICVKPRSKWRDVPFYRAYAVLTLCRISYSFNISRVDSKPRAARWAVRHLPATWTGLITQALESDAGKRRSPISLSHIRRFLTFTEARLRVKTPKQ